MKNEEKSSFVFGFAAKAADYTPAVITASLFFIIRRRAPYPSPVADGC